ncbi:MAG TPA: gliding motility-associated C-terminal domain-containing protein [Brumimicrobium sp.]|nr:gliding motility-associated C-terminal domain-containing protein [Brumimicrobium sp.]
MNLYYKIFSALALIIGYQSSSNSYAQNNSIVLNGAFIVLDGGTTANNIYIVVDQPSPSGIVRLPAGGHIHSENQYNFVKWLSGTTTGSYVVPFGIGGNATDYIPFTFNKTAGNSSINSSTWATNIQNTPHPAATNVGAVTEMTGITDSVAYAIDRFWDIRATATTADLTFSYRGAENTTSSPTSLVQAQHWNGNTWDAPVGPGTIGVTAGIGTAGPYIGQNTFSPWVLIVPCTPDSVTQNPIICQNSSITVGTNTYSTTGVYIDDLINVLGCDSVVTTNLTVNPSSTGTDIQNACGSFTWIDGITYSANNNSATHTLINGAANGCDSIVTLDLTINNNANATGTDTQITCGSFSWIDGVTYTASNNSATHTIIGGAVNGCDSIVTLDLTINTPTIGTDTQSACVSYTWIDGNTYTTNNNTAIHTIVGGNANGCDSIVTLDLTINTPTIGTDTQSACVNYTWIDGNTYTTNNNSATHTIVGGNANGCDSIVTLDLTIITKPTVNATSNAPICQGDTLNLNATKINGALYQWSGPNGFISQDQNPTVNVSELTNNGTYQIITSVGNNCADTAHVNVHIIPSPILISSVSDDQCGANVGEISIEIDSPNLPFTYTWNDGTTDSILADLSEGKYSVTVTDNSACSTEESYTIFNAKDDCNCFVYVANAFSPNGDNNNDFIPVRGECVLYLNFKIFNRWGNLVYETDQLNEGWDGYYKGELQNTGVYVYLLEVTFENGESVKESGDINLIR